MRSRSLIVGALIVGLLAAVSGVQANAPSFRGSTGLIVIPSAGTLSAGQYNAGMFLDSDSNSVFVGNLGLTPSLELGFSRFSGGGGNTWLNAKYNLIPETGNRPAIAAGVMDFTDNTTTYLVMSRSLAWQGAGSISSPEFHLGIGGGRMDGIFAGLSAALGDRILLMAEYDSSDLNLGARMAISDELRVHAALMGLTNELVAGLSYTTR